MGGGGGVLKNNTVNHFHVSQIMSLVIIYISLHVQTQSSGECVSQPDILKTHPRAVMNSVPQILTNPHPPLKIVPKKCSVVLFVL